MARGKMSSDIEDTGRKASERVLRSKQTKYLQDVVEQVDKDYEDLLNQIKKRQQAGSRKNDPFLTSIDSLLHPATAAEGEEEHSPTATISSIETTLRASTTLLKWRIALNHSLATASADANNYATFLQTRAEEQQRVKEILAAGKRVFDGELGAVGGEGEVMEQARAVFGEGLGPTGGDAGAETLVKDVLKGVRKMTKGMSDGV